MNGDWSLVALIPPSFFDCDSLLPLGSFSVYILGAVCIDCLLVARTGTCRPGGRTAISSLKSGCVGRPSRTRCARRSRGHPRRRPELSVTLGAMNLCPPSPQSCVGDIPVQLRRVQTRPQLDSVGNEQVLAAAELLNLDCLSRTYCIFVPLRRDYNQKVCRYAFFYIGDFFR